MEQSLGFNGYQAPELVSRNGLSFIRDVLENFGGRDKRGETISEEVKSQLVVLRQCHTDTIHSFSAWPASDFSAEGDGLVTNRVGLLLGVLVADCMPVLIVDIERRVAAAVHAGWRGTAKRIVEKAVEVMRHQFGARPQTCRAVIGPSIRGCCYEVGEEVVRAFRGEFEYDEHLFQIRQNGKRSLDLPMACRSQLLRAGFESTNIFADPPCTSCNLERFFSHRAEAGKTGRMMGLIGILDKP